MMFDIKFFHKIGQTLGNVIKQLQTTAQHQLLRDGVNFVFHVETFAINVDQQHSEVGSTQVESKKLAMFCKLEVKSVGVPIS